MKNKNYFYVNPAIQNLEKYLKKRKTILRKLQVPLFKDIVDFIKDHKINKGRGYVVGPMGSGKTVIFTELVETIGQRAIICVPTTQLVRQTCEEFAIFAPTIKTGVVYSKRKKKEFDADVLITTHASLVVNIKNGKLNPKDFNWLILDEVHEMLSGPRRKAVNAFKHAITIGFTASDKYDEEKEVAKLLPTEIHRISIVEGVEGGLLCPFSVIIAETNTSLATVQSAGKDYSQKELERAVNTEGRNRSAVALYEKNPFFKGKSLMCHCISTRHADAVAAKFRKNGWKAAAVHYEIPDKKRDELIEQFRSGELTVLCGVNQLARGFNAPIVSLCFNLFPTRSLVKATQRARNLRLDKNNADKFAVIVEFLDKDFNKKTPPITFDQIINNRAVVTPSSWNGTKKLRKIEKQIGPTIKLKGLQVHTRVNEVLRISGDMQKRAVQTFAPEKEIHEFIQKMKFKSKDEYNNARLDNYPVAGHFDFVYGKTYRQVAIGRRQSDWPTEKELVKYFFTEGFTGQKDYEENHSKIYPSARSFTDIYKKTFGEIIRGGKRKTTSMVDWISEDEVRKIFKRKKFKGASDYQKNRPKGCPSAGHFKRIYGKGFNEVMHGKVRSVGGWLSATKVRKFFKDGGFKNRDEYDKARSTSTCPVSRQFPKIYGKSFAEVVYGQRGKPKARVK